MEHAIYTEMQAVEDRHWWFAGRRAVAAAAIARLGLPAGAKILEAGCGSGGNLAMLARFGNVFAFELHDPARETAQARGIGRVEAGRLPDAIPFTGERFDLIVLFDVLEHVEDDAAALRALRERVAPGGALLLTVPAFKLLWSRHDVAHHHHRRYSRRELREKAAQAGFCVERADYFNFWLFPAALLMRLIERADMDSPRPPAGHGMPPAWLNTLLFKLFSSERFWLSRTGFPFGMSILLAARGEMS